MKAKAIEVKDCPTGLSDSWDQFPWGLYRGGVDVTFALVRGRAIYLVRQSKHCFGLTRLSLKPGQVLADLIPLVPGSRGATGEVCASYDDGYTFRVLVLLRNSGESMASFKELTNDPLLLGGYASGDVMAAFAARALGWDADVDKHLPLPQTTTLAEAA